MDVGGNTVTMPGNPAEHAADADGRRRRTASTRPALPGNADNLVGDNRQHPEQPRLR